MNFRARVRNAWEWALNLGSYPGEPASQRGKRRLIVGLLFVSVVFRIPDGLSKLGEGLTWVAVFVFIGAAASAVAPFALQRWPHRYALVINMTFVAFLVEPTSETLLVGGIMESSAVIAWLLLGPVGALLALSIRNAVAWLVIDLVTLNVAIGFPDWFEPLYEAEGSASEIAANLSGVMFLVSAAMLYFVRQRDRFQQESDDLLHNILPDEIATRLKTDTSMIADDFPHASVLFCDVVGFTPMSATMTPPQLVGLLNQVFTQLDQFVEELGLEKIKTIGDEYMVAAGVPIPRDDHAEAIAKLALKIRDHMANTEFDGHRLEMRIGIHSGPVVAGIIGTHKFAYDLWGDTVNTASRMESGGIAGQIQVTPTTHDLLQGNGYRFEPRGAIEVKGKGQMNTWLLTGRA